MLARRLGREGRPGRATFALHGVWEAEHWDVPDITHTLVETTPGGWAWSIPVTERRRHVTVMIDPPAGTLEATLDDAYRSELCRDGAFLPHWCGTRGSRQTDWRAFRFTLRRPEFAGPGWALVGDAASFIDPLSSFGIKKALAAAWLAAVVVHTSLTDSSLTGAGDRALRPAGARRVP